MSGVGRALVIASGVQGGTAKAHDALLVALVIAALAVVAVAILVYTRKRPRRSEPVTDQWRALAMMGELCPHGWKAQITLYGWNAPAPADAPPSRAPLVELEWTLYDEEHGHIAVARRVWARTIPEALQTMIDDRRTDLTLEQIERAAEEQDEVWWDD
jgi:hypothetical protein